MTRLSCMTCECNFRNIFYLCRSEEGSHISYTRALLLTLVVAWRMRLLMSSSEPNCENSVTNILAFGAIIADEISIKPSSCSIHK